MTVTNISWNPDLPACPDDEAILLLFSDGEVTAAWRYDQAAGGFHPFVVWTEGVADCAPDLDATEWPGDLIGCVDLLFRQFPGGTATRYPVAWASVSSLYSPGAARAIIEAAAAKTERERMEGNKE